MARKRMIDPSFWDDEKIGNLSFGARLLFIGMWNFSDDEGLIRFSPEYLKSSIFSYDEKTQTTDVEKMMKELISKDFVYSYIGGINKQRYAYIINFRKHQRIDKPQPSKFTPPSIQNTSVVHMYAKRDGFICHLCNEPITGENIKNVYSPDHLVPRSKGGSDYPSNIKTSHISCNKSKRDKLLIESGEKK